MHVACCVIIGVKEIGVLRVFRSVIRHPDLENEGLEKPTSMREVPFRWADVGYRLHDAVFRLERFTELLREPAHFAITRQEGIPAIIRSDRCGLPRSRRDFVYCWGDFHFCSRS